jgi:hypothetical protein
MTFKAPYIACLDVTWTSGATQTATTSFNFGNYFIYKLRYYYRGNFVCGIEMAAFGKATSIMLGDKGDSSNGMQGITGEIKGFSVSTQSPSQEFFHVGLRIEEDKCIPFL